MTQMRSPRPQARRTMPNAAVDFPFPFPVLTITSPFLWFVMLPRHSRESVLIHHLLREDERCTHNRMPDNFDRRSVGGTDILSLDHLLRGTQASEFAVHEHGDPICKERYQVEVMQRHEHREVLFLR